MDFELSSYYPVFLFVVVVIAVGLGILALCHLVGPHKKTPVKQMPYESGMDPIGSARQRFDVKYYLIAILFLVFDVELLFLYPWAVSAYERFTGAAQRLRDPIFWELLVFVGTLAVAYVYAWRKGVFRWR
jgi:NADH:ubiquinone oxidoreductase subunit 3 (subunit A)